MKMAEIEVAPYLHERGIFWPNENLAAMLALFTLAIYPLTLKNRM